MISADHPRFSCTSDMSLTIYGEISSGPLVHTNDPSGTGVLPKHGIYKSTVVFKIFWLGKGGGDIMRGSRKFSQGGGGQGKFPEGV